MNESAIDLYLACAALALSAVVFGGCGDEAGDATVDASDGDGRSDGVDLGADTVDEPVAPVISQLFLAENPSNALSATVELETDVVAVVSVTVDNGDDHRFTVTAEDARTDHVVNLLGLRFDETYDVSVTARSQAGGTATESAGTLITAAVPDDFPVLDVSVSEPERMAPGFTLINVTQIPGGSVNDRWGLFLMTDATGRIVWYHRVDRKTTDVSVLGNGNLLYILSGATGHEVDLMGNTINSWRPSELSPPTETFHHDFQELSNGNLMVLSVELREVGGFPDPDNEGETISYNLAGDLIHEFGRDGTILQTWAMLDVLSQYRHRVRPGFESPHWRFSDAPGGSQDWTHSNAIVVDESNNLVTVSARHQDWIVAFDRTTGALVWRLGCDGDFRLTNGEGAAEGCDPDWFYHQHAHELQPDGSYLIYDNGNFRPGSGPNYSRAVLLSLDSSSTNRADWTATIEWEYVNDTLPNYAGFASDADRLSNGNVLIADGGLRESSRDLFMARVVEVTGDSPADKVFELVLTPVPAGDDGPDIGWNLYRADRVESLYGSGYTVE